ncbi:hypothetical protein [Bradyrhizobium yuanmingense]|uniref:hypothetical protein n=1 Tax=Bradyrhizobium yuanmingense TaxID=108015 RepID=UPI001CD46ECA|nr:hypothetical protein [Bradyrhizobium yuanmingense]MCA1526513.1 hypothetical protein [Bradyrhizobium yuanmingense]
MDKDRRPPQESSAENETDVPRPNRDIDSRWDDHAMKDVLEDDEVREAINLGSRGKTCSERPVSKQG